MLTDQVSVSIRLAIHFGKWVTSKVSLTAVLIDRVYDLLQARGSGKHTDALARELIRHYILFWKIRRRAFRLAVQAYPDMFDNADPTKRNVALANLLLRMEATAGKLDEAIKRNIHMIACEGLQEYAVLLWRGRPNPPPFIELEMARWTLHELDEDCALSHDSLQKGLRGNKVAMQQWFDRVKRDMDGKWGHRE